MKVKNINTITLARIIESELNHLVSDLKGRYIENVSLEDVESNVADRIGYIREVLKVNDEFKPIPNYFRDFVIQAQRDSKIDNLYDEYLSADKVVQTLFEEVKHAVGINLHMVPEYVLGRFKSCSVCVVNKKHNEIAETPEQLHTYTAAVQLSLFSGIGGIVRRKVKLFDIVVEYLEKSKTLLVAFVSDYVLNDFFKQCVVLIEKSETFDGYTTKYEYVHDTSEFDT